MFIAKRENGEKIHLLYHHDEEILHRMRKKGKLRLHSLWEKSTNEIRKTKKVAFCS